MGHINGLKPIKECWSDPPKAGAPTGQTGVLKQMTVELQDEDGTERERFSGAWTCGK